MMMMMMMRAKKDAFLTLQIRLRVAHLSLPEDLARPFFLAGFFRVLLNELSERRTNQTVRKKQVTLEKKKTNKKKPPEKKLYTSYGYYHLLSIFFPLNSAMMMFW